MSMAYARATTLSRARAGRAAGRVLNAVAPLRNRRFRTRLRPDPAAPILLLSPHLDDAVLSCWSLLRSEFRLTVVTVFAGIPPPGRTGRWDAVAGVPNAVALMRARRAEDAAALALAGRRGVHLPFLESQYRRLQPPLEHDRLDRLLAGIRRAVREVVAPAALGVQHEDHATLRDYALALAKQGIPVRLYADVPYCTVYGWPSWVTGQPARPHLDVDAAWAIGGGPSPLLLTREHAVVERLSPEESSAKLAAMRAYLTQFPTLDRGPIAQLSNPQVHPFELFAAAST